ncbi:MAG: archease [Haloferacaceae archaeon]
MTGSFALRDHTADVGVEATGQTLGDAFAACADGMAAAMCDSIPDCGDRFAVTVRAEGREALLFDYLDRLIYERDVRAVLPVDSEATVSGTGTEWVVEASARGVPLDRVRAREIKAVTYSEMAVEETAAGWRAYVVLDV